MSCILKQTILKNHQLTDFEHFEMCVRYPKLSHQMVGSNQISKSKSKMTEPKILKNPNSQIQKDPKVPNSKFRIVFQRWNKHGIGKKIKIGNGP